MFFLDKNFLLQTKTAELLYHNYAKKLPIIGYHNHLNLKFKTLLLRNYANLETLEFVKKINVNAIGDGYHTNLTEEFMTYAHDNGIEVFQ